MDLTSSISPDIPILVVDDIPSARNVLVRFLKRLGFTNVHEAAAGKEAGTLASEQAFQLIISDLHLKDMLGTDLLKAVRSGSLNTKVPFIMVTSDMSNESYQFTTSCLNGVFLTKPFSREVLAEKLAQVLVPKK